MKEKNQGGNVYGSTAFTMQGAPCEMEAMPITMTLPRQRIGLHFKQLPRTTFARNLILFLASGRIFKGFDLTLAAEFKRFRPAVVWADFGIMSGDSLGLELSPFRVYLFEKSRSLGRSVVPSLGRWVARSLDFSLARSLNRSIAGSIARSIIRSLGRSIV